MLFMISLRISYFLRFGLYFESFLFYFTYIAYKEWDLSTLYWNRL